MSAEDLDFFARHHGGFDRQFFISNLVLNLGAYMEARGLPAEQVQVMVVLETGEELHVLHGIPALTWVAFDTEDGERRIVPMGAVRQVKLRRRPGDPAPIGFSVQVDQSQPTQIVQGD